MLRNTDELVSHCYTQPYSTHTRTLHSNSHAYICKSIPHQRQLPLKQVKPSTISMFYEKRYGNRALWGKKGGGGIA